MPNTYTCSVCHHQFIVSDKVFEQRILGRRVTIPCKHCGAPFTMDGTAKGGQEASGRTATGGGTRTEVRSAQNVPGRSAPADATQAIALAQQPQANLVPSGSSGEPPAAESPIATIAEPQRSLKRQPPRPDPIRLESTKSTAPEQENPAQAQEISVMPPTLSGQASHLCGDVLLNNPDLSSATHPEPRKHAVEGAPSVIPKRVSVPRPAPTPSRAPKRDDAAPAARQSNQVSAADAPQPPLPVRARFSGDGYQAVTSQMLLSAEPVVAEEPIVPTPVVEVGAHGHKEMAAAVPDGSVSGPTPPPLPRAPSAIPPLPRQPTKIACEPVEPTRPTLPGGPPPLPPTASQTGSMSSESAESQRLSHPGRASAVPPLPRRATPALAESILVEPLATARSGSELPPLVTPDAPCTTETAVLGAASLIDDSPSIPASNPSSASATSQLVQERGSESELTPPGMTRTISTDVPPLGMAEESCSSVGNLTSLPPRPKRRIGRFLTIGAAAGAVIAAVVIAGRSLERQRVQATVLRVPASQAPRTPPKTDVAVAPTRERGPVLASAAVEPPPVMPLSKADSSAMAVVPATQVLPRAEPAAVAGSLATPKDATDTAAQSSSSDGIPASLAKSSLRLQADVALRRAQRCHPEGHPAGTAQIFITISPSGTVSDLKIVGEPIASAAVAGCILQQMRVLRIPKFEGSSFTFERSITLR